MCRAVRKEIGKGTNRRQLSRMPAFKRGRHAPRAPAPPSGAARSIGAGHPLTRCADRTPQWLLHVQDA